MGLDLAAGIVRILKPDGATAGAGFVVSDRGLVATCAHVARGAGVGPGEAIRLAFQATGDEREALVEPGWWREPEAEDEAVLWVAGELPPEVHPLPLGRAGASQGHQFRGFGFPDLSPEGGIWCEGQILGGTTVRGRRMLQLRSPEVTLGFSGAPVWDDQAGQVVGMITSIAPPDPYGRLSGVAFATPVDVLLEIWAGTPLAAPSEAERELIQRSSDMLRPAEPQPEALYLALDSRQEQVRRVFGRLLPKPRPIDLLRQATKLFTGDLAEALTGKPRPRLRQACLTRASKLPHRRYLDVEFLEQAADQLAQLDREIRVLLSASQIAPVSGLREPLEHRARTLAGFLGRIYRIEVGELAGRAEEA